MKIVIIKNQWNEFKWKIRILNEIEKEIFVYTLYWWVFFSSSFWYSFIPSCAIQIPMCNRMKWGQGAYFVPLPTCVAFCSVTILWLSIFKKIISGWFYLLIFVSLFMLQPTLRFFSSHSLKKKNCYILCMKLALNLTFVHSNVKNVIYIHILWWLTFLKCHPFEFQSF